MLKGKIVLLAGVLVVLGSAALHADVFTGTLYYTNWCCSVTNVNKVDYNYDDSTNTLTMGAPQGLASLAGADGIIFDASGHLLVGGQGANALYKLNTDGTGVTSVHPPGNSFHLALDPSGNFVYTSDFGGALDVVPLSHFADGTQHAIVSGIDRGVTQLAFAPDSGKVFYDNSGPNCCGAFGTIDISDLSNISTTRIGTGNSVHGIIFDPYTKMITTFGGGWAGAVNQDGTGFHEAHIFSGDFDQGAPDGKGHAFVAGSNGISFFDYRASGDITAPNYSTFVSGFGFIDDLAPLSGVGSNPNPDVPEPSSIFLLGSALAGFVAYRRRRSQTT